ncbi:MAG TPA: YCF48-related protein [Ignavibacteriaceae bacterium]|nr:YCF48-related protein [Ignavibacteriaceae bacterium]
MKKLFIILITFFTVLTQLKAQFMPERSFLLNGTDNSAYIGAASFPSTNSVTIAGWVRLQSNANQTIVAKNYNSGTENSGQYELYVTSDGGINFLKRVSGADFISGSPGTLELQKWYYVAGIFDATNVKALINGSLTSSNPAAGDLDVSSSHPFSVGAQRSISNTLRNYFNGNIENLTIWSSALDINTLKDWMHKEITSSHPYYTNLIALYKFNEYDNSSYISDQSGNNRGLSVTGTRTYCFSTALPPTCYTYGKLKDHSEVRGIWYGTGSNSSSILTITNNSISGTDYALWGHNNKSLLWNYFDIPDGVEKRMERVWHSEQSGNPVSDFVFSTAGLAIPDGNRLRMLVDEDPNFYNAIIVTGVYSSDNNTFTVADRAVEDGFYYTLAVLTEGGGNGGIPSTPAPWKWLNPIPQGNDLYGVNIFDDNEFCAVGDGGTLVYTENGGITFKVTHFLNNFSGRLNTCGTFPGTNVTIAAGDKGAYFKSTNLGDPWETPEGTGLDGNIDYRNIHFVDGNFAFICGGEGKVYKTSNRGESWTPQTTNLTGNIGTISFYDSQRGWAFDDFSYSVTTNGGSSWDWRFNTPGPVLSSVLLSETDGLVSCANGKIFGTTDLGETWTEKYSGSNNINKLTKIGGGTLILGGGNNGTIVKSTDSGNNWTSPTSNITNNILDIYTKGNLTVFTAKNGMICSSPDVCNTINKISSGINDRFHSVAIISSNLLISLVGRNKLYKSTDGGESWTQIHAGGESDNYNSASFSDANNGFIVGENGKLIKTTDGSNFTDISIGATNNISKVSLKSGSGYKDKLLNSENGENSILAILYTTTTGSNDQQIISISTNSGSTWVPVRSVLASSNQIANSVSYFLPGLFAVSKDGKVLKSTDDGGNWTVTSLSSSNSLNDVSFSDVNNGMVIGDKGIIFKTTDGGTNWVSKSNCGNSNLSKVSVMNASRAIIFAADGTIYETTDGGDTWKSSVVNLSSSINNLIGIAALKLGKEQNEKTSDFIYFALGEGGLVLKNSDGGIGLFPVELISFSADVKNHSVWLSWETATELNCYGFEIMRAEVSLDISKPHSWKKEGFIPGSGNSNALKRYCFRDENIFTGKYRYRLRIIDNDGTYTYSAEIDVLVGNPEEFSLGQNYPNPFNPVTKIGFNIPVSAKNKKVTLKIVNLLGEDVETLISGFAEPGYHVVQFDASKLSSGIYIYLLNTGGRIMSRKMIFLK